MFKNWKTTLAGIVVTVATFGGPLLGASDTVVRIATAIGIAFGLISAKDHNVTGDGS